MKTTLHLPGQVRALLASENPTRLSLDSLRRDAKASGLAQVIAHSSDPSRVVAVFPDGGVWGAGGSAMGWADMLQELNDWDVACTERVGEVMG